MKSLRCILGFHDHVIAHHPSCETKGAIHLNNPFAMCEGELEETPGDLFKGAIIRKGQIMEEIVFRRMNRLRQLHQPIYTPCSRCGAEAT